MLCFENSSEYRLTNDRDFSVCPTGVGMIPKFNEQMLVVMRLPHGSGDNSVLRILRTLPKRSARGSGDNSGERI